MCDIIAFQLIEHFHKTLFQSVFVDGAGKTEFVPASPYRIGETASAMDWIPTGDVAIDESMILLEADVRLVSFSADKIVKDGCLGAAAMVCLRMIIGQDCLSFVPGQMIDDPCMMVIHIIAGGLAIVL